LVYFSIRSSAVRSSIRTLILLALLLSLFGDIALLFDDKSSLYFILGLGSFLFAHILYILSFWKQRDSNKNALGFIMLLLTYATILFFKLKDDLGDLLIPVVIYMFTILGMATTAFIRKQDDIGLSYKLVLIGAVLFMISDSILAFDKFSHPLPYSTISIMSTYALAQYCITMGILKHKD
ncbi:MAG: lysoplasmalogenase, partial [Psychroserpens sp.]|nr:lysoplasmalogenase [Psychroserpens sp.]